MLDAGQKAPGGPWTLAHRRIGGEDGAALGRAVALQDSRAEFLHPQIDRGILELLSPGKQVAQGPKIVGMGLARIAGQERIRAEENRAVEVVKGRRDDAIMNW